MTTAIANQAYKVRFGSFYLTERQIAAYLDASTKKRAKLHIQYRRGGILTDQDADNIVGDMAMWRLRWLRRVAGRS